jgi:plasmid stabilization system protein ParE
MAAGRRSVIWTESARAALDDVVTYIAQDSREAALRVLAYRRSAGLNARRGMRRSYMGKAAEHFAAKPPSTLANIFSHPAGKPAPCDLGIMWS